MAASIIYQLPGQVQVTPYNPQTMTPPTYASVYVFASQLSLYNAPVSTPLPTTIDGPSCGVYYMPAWGTAPADFVGQPPSTVRTINIGGALTRITDILRAQNSAYPTAPALNPVWGIYATISQAAARWMFPLATRIPVYASSGAPATDINNVPIYSDVFSLVPTGATPFVFASAFPGTPQGVFAVQ